MGGGALLLGALLARLLWLAINREEGVERLPEGWAASRVVSPIRVRNTDAAVLRAARTRLDALLAGELENFCQWIVDRRAPSDSPFERAWLDAEFESLREWFRPSFQLSPPPAS